MRSLWLEHQKLTYRKEVPSPIPKKGQALIRVLLSGVCSTDLELVRGYYPFSGIPGHEFVGEVVSSPDDLTWIGKRVVGEININCGNCDTCKSGLPRHCENRKTLGIYDWNGAFADYLVLPQINLHEVPHHVTNEMAVFIEPLAAAHEILEQTSINETNHVLIIGAGRLGLLAAMVIQQTGCGLDVVTRHEKQRLFLEKRKISAISGQNIGSRKYDIVIEATGSADGFALACKTIRPRGRIILKSTYKGNSEVNFSEIVVDEVTLIGSRCGSFEPALRLLAAAKADPLPLIEAIFPLDRGLDAIELAARPGMLKILIKPG
jgi:threonine dehydrogenase-like Zn-dependent dehydrogenase